MPSAIGELRSGLLSLRLVGWSRCRLGGRTRIADKAEAIDDEEWALALGEATTQQPISRTHRLTAGYGDGDLVEARVQGGKDLGVLRRVRILQAELELKR